MQKVSITHMNNAHSDWQRSLDFYKSELGILKGRLTEIASKNTHAEVLRHVEHFENQFKLQTYNIQSLAHDIKAHIKTIGKEAEVSKAGYVDGELSSQHRILSQRYESEEKIVNELRQSFNKFAVEWM